MEKLTNELHEKISSKVIWKIIWIKGEFKEKSIFSISWFINTFDLETMSTCNTFQPIWITCWRCCWKRTWKNRKFLIKRLIQKAHLKINYHIPDPLKLILQLNESQYWYWQYQYIAAIYWFVTLLLPLVEVLLKNKQRTI